MNQIADKLFEKEMCIISVVVEKYTMSDKYWETSVWNDLSKCHQ